MENIKELFAEWGLWSLVEDISDDGDGTGDNLQLTKEGEEARRMIEQELDKAREEERVNMLDNMVQYLKDTKNLTLMFNPMSELTRAKQEWEVKIYEHLIENFSKLKSK